MLDLDQMPLYEFQTLYYQLWKDRIAEEKMSKEERAGIALQNAIEDEL